MSKGENQQSNAETGHPMKEAIGRSEYLGDGVYAEKDVTGSGVWLDCRAQNGLEYRRVPCNGSWKTVEAIFLDHSTVQSLARFMGVASINY